MGGVSAAGAIEDFVSIGDHGGKAVLGLVYMEIQDFARFTMIVRCKELKKNQHFTQPPARYTEAYEHGLRKRILKDAL